MPQISKRKPSRDIQQNLIENLHKVLNSARSKSDLLQLIHAVLTPTEIVMVSKRIAIALMIKQKYKYNDIKIILKVSQSTVARVKANITSMEGGYYHEVLDKLISKKQQNIFLGQIDELLGKISPPKKGVNWKVENKKKRMKSAKIQRRKNIPS